jgi:predicted alpha/beta-hydrolase family hydrolase
MAASKNAFLVNEPRGGAKATLVLAHGAGSAMDSLPLTFFAEELARSGLRVVRFEFPYMRLRRAEGWRKPPDKANSLMQSWREVISQLGGGTGLVVGGKSMGGRIASMIADEAGVRGLVCLGYPFHPLGKPSQHRTRHLKSLKTPALIVQGERDRFGNSQEVPDYELSKNIRIVWIADGDHSFKPSKRSGRTERQNLEQVVSHMSAFVLSLKVDCKSKQ